MRSVDIYIPTESATATGARLIAKGSGIVGRDGSYGLEVYYEGNLYRAANIITFADRVYHAASRMEASYPTAARGVYPRVEFEHVGTFTADRVQLDADGGALTRLARWIGAGEDDGEFFVPDAARLAAELRRS